MNDYFQIELQHLLNAHSKENGSNTADFILAEYLSDCLAVWNKNVMRREQWYGRPAVSGEMHPPTPLCDP